MIDLRPLTGAEFEIWATHSIEKYADDKRRVLNISAKNAKKLAAETFAKFLPRGQFTNNAHIHAICDPDGVTVGHLWFMIRTEWGVTEVFIYDIEIYPGHRRRGFGRAALKALEQRAGELGASRIGLHVFGDNASAIALYRKCGYDTTDMTMYRRVLA